MSENPWRVTFTGGPAGEGEEFELPVEHLERVPYLCTGGVGDYLHWRLGDQPRVFEYVGFCTEVPGPHAFDLSDPDIRCPKCKEVSRLVITPDQAMCTNAESCTELFFDPTEQSSIRVRQD